MRPFSSTRVGVGRVIASWTQRTYVEVSGLQASSPSGVAAERPSPPSVALGTWASVDSFIVPPVSALLTTSAALTAPPFFRSALTREPSTTSELLTMRCVA